MLLRDYSTHLFFVAYTILCLPLTLAAESPQQRAMSAARQLREYHQRLGSDRLKAQSRDLNGAGSVGISIDRSMQSSSTIFFYDNMEGGANGWTSVAYSGSDLWHQTTADASSPIKSWRAGDDLLNNYANGARVNDALISPSIDLSAATGPVTLLFAEQYVTEQGWDYCMVAASTDGGSSWNELRGNYGSAPSGSSDGWQITSLDLSPYAGSSVLLRFYFDTGDEKYNDFPGWFVDDVVVFDQGGTITGRKFFDVNNNGSKDIGERGVKEWLITATGPITLTTRTNYRGRYWFTVPLGSYTLTEEFKPNWTQKYPLSGSWVVNVATPDTLIDSIHFGNYTQASFINGRKFHDIDENGLFDGADTLLGEWKIVLEDTLGNEIDFDRTDSIGEYSLYVFQPGRYVVREVHKSGWVQSSPVGETYTIDIPDLNTVSNGNDFGNYYSPSTNAIIGQKFNDRNRNGIWDIGENAEAGFKIQLLRKGNGNSYSNFKLRTTDSSGYYEFLSLPADTYKVRELPQIGWWQSYPESTHALILQSGGTEDSVNFGNFEIEPGSISGSKYNDMDTSGSRNGEPGLGGWRVVLDGRTYFNLSVTEEVETDANGDYNLAGVWPGSYTVSEVWRSGWRQTQPEDLLPHTVNLGLEEDRTGVDFGNVLDSSFSVGFRTFRPESLALAIDLAGKHKPVKAKPDKVDFKFNLVWRAEGTVTLKFPMLTTGDVRVGKDKSAPVIFHWDNLKAVTFTPGPPFIPGAVIQIDGRGAKPKPFTVKYVWKNSAGGVIDKGMLPAEPSMVGDELKLSLLRYPMPNAINMLELAGAGLGVGLGGPHSVIHPTYKEILKSLIEKADRMRPYDVASASCLGTFSSGKSIKKQQKYITPTKHNNKLLDEAIALQANILGSDAGILPGGFGNLIFDDGTGIDNPMNGLAIREIATKLDSFMSSYVDTGVNIGCYGYVSTLTGMDAEILWSNIRMINGAFSGPLDTVSFATGLRFTEVAPLSSVSFLRVDPRAQQRIISVRHAEAVETPQGYALYQNYPNPFNPTTTIEFYLDATSRVSLTVYNALGQKVATLLDGQEMEDGFQEAIFDASSLSSGVYFYRLSTQEIVDQVVDEEEIAPLGRNFTTVKKMLLVR